MISRPYFDRQTVISVSRLTTNNVLQVAFSLREKKANSESTNPSTSERHGNHGVMLIGLLLAEREG
jgi:hypothetical protein